MLQFLALLVAGAVAAVYIACIFMCAKWLKDHIAKRLQNRENHKVVFVSTKDIIDDELKNEIDKSDEISMSDLENLCEKTPFTSVEMDRETDDLTNQEGIKPENGVDENFAAHMKQHKGILIFD